MLKMTVLIKMSYSYPRINWYKKMTEGIPLTIKRLIERTKKED